MSWESAIVAPWRKCKVERSQITDLVFKNSPWMDSWSLSMAPGSCATVASGFPLATLLVTTILLLRLFKTNLSSFVRSRMEFVLLYLMEKTHNSGRNVDTARKEKMPQATVATPKYESKKYMLHIIQRHWWYDDSTRRFTLWADTQAIKQRGTQNLVFRLDPPMAWTRRSTRGN